LALLQTEVVEQNFFIEDAGPMLVPCWSGCHDAPWDVWKGFDDGIPRPQDGITRQEGVTYFETDASARDKVLHRFAMLGLFLKVL
jgi:hypothetical protein